MVSQKHDCKQVRFAICLFESIIILDLSLDNIQVQSDWTLEKTFVVLLARLYESAGRAIAVTPASALTLALASALL